MDTRQSPVRISPSGFAPIRAVVVMHVTVDVDHDVERERNSSPSPFTGLAMFRLLVSPGVTQKYPSLGGGGELDEPEYGYDKSISTSEFQAASQFDSEVICFGN